MANGVVHIGSDDNKVYALNARTGSLVWSYTTGYQVFSSPAVANGVVYVTSEDSNVYALNAKTGAKLWYTAFKHSVESSPAVANGVVYIGLDDHKVHAFGLKKGREQPPNDPLDLDSELEATLKGDISNVASG